MSFFLFLFSSSSSSLLFSLLSSSLLKLSPSFILLLGPARGLILHDSGCIPVLVNLLALEGLKNTQIVANSLFCLNILALEIDCCTVLANCSELAGHLEALYRTDSKVYQQLTASIVCRVFGQLANVGRETNFVLGVKDRGRDASLSVSGAPPRPPGSAPAASVGGALGLLVRFLDSKKDHTVMLALSVIETLTYHFDNVVAMCELNEPNLLNSLVSTVH